MSSSTQARRLAPLLSCLFGLFLLPGCYAGFMGHHPGYHHRVSSGVAAFGAAADLIASIFYAVEAAQQPPPPPEVYYPAGPPPAARNIDEPGLAPRPAPAPEPVVTGPSLPSSAEVKRVMTGLEPELRRCSPSAHLGWVKVTLRVDGSGSLRAAGFGTKLDPAVRRCVEDRLARARLSSFASGPVSVDYLLDLR